MKADKIWEGDPHSIARVPLLLSFLSQQLLQRLDHLKDQGVTVLLPGDARLLGPGEQRSALRGLVLLPEAAEQLSSPDRSW